MFEELATRLEDALKTLRGQDKISETNIESAIKSVRKALLDADVNLEIVNEFIRDIRIEAQGTEVARGVTPDQKFIDIVYKKLTNIMGESNEKLLQSTHGPTVIMLVGLQGAGKTTVAAKLSLFLKHMHKRVLLIAADTFRPAAKDQLQSLGLQVGTEVYVGLENESSHEIVSKGRDKATEEDFDVVIVDTAGRLYIDETLMNELSKIKLLLNPHETLLVVDSMAGQEAAELTRVFNDKVNITGAILTKLDGDSRGGAALSIRKVSGKPIKFIGTGEKVDALEPFYPDRIASRILGMGDILTLVDKAQKEVELADITTMQKKFQEASFNFTDFLQQMKLIQRMGSLGGLMKLLPGMNKIDEKTLKSGESQLKRIQSMIDSMTLLERTDPKVLLKSPQRRRRIALGSGYTQQDVDKMITDFEKMRNMMQGIVKGDFSRLMANPLLAAGERQLTTKHSKQQHISPTTNVIGKKKEIKRRKGFFDL
jgi:signal recognition particle subunit SRP54